MADSPFVPPAWLEERLGSPDLAVLDASWYLPAMARDAAAEFRSGHVPGAVRFDIDTVRDRESPHPHILPSPETFAAEAGALGIGDGTTIVVYDGMGLFAAPRVWWMFRTFGAKEVFILDGGFPAWRAEGRPVETGEARVREPRVFTARFDPGVVAAAEDVRRAIDSGTAQVLDARSAERFRGDAPEPRAGIRPGRIPGSLNLPWDKVVESGRLKEPGALREALEEAGVEAGRPVITTCGSGVSAAILWLALEAAGERPQALYDGSWAEWGSRTDLPVATGPR